MTSPKVESDPSKPETDPGSQNGGIFAYADSELIADLQSFTYDHNCLKAGKFGSLLSPFTVKAIMTGSLLWLMVFSVVRWPLLLLSQQLTNWAAVLTFI
mmetsp:Transcript_3754/g.4298  ORF Transcript_3754/g.4298 Transcript_3754/m.4298 type:complete len:99 (-) Transcript_3754:595-891(-)